jgi:hypothetical protein
VWATESNAARVTGACGPLDPRDADTGLLDYLSYRTDDAAWFQENRHDFIFIAGRDTPLYEAGKRIREASQQLAKEARQIRDAAELGRVESELRRQQRRAPSHD